MKVSFASAAPQERTMFPLDCFHPCTLDFGRTIPSTYLECVQGDTMDIDFMQVFRMTPLVVPTFGNARFMTRAFFVPYRVIDPAWENFISEQQDTTVKRTLRSYTNQDFVKYFTPTLSGESASDHPDHNLMTIVDNSVPKCDVCLDYAYVDSNNVGQHDLVKLNFTERGRWLYQVLCGLKYNLNWVYTTRGGNDGGDLTPFDILPLKSFCRAIYDYIYPSAYVGTQGFGWIFENPDLFTDIGHFMDVVERLLFAPYEQDHYTAAWQTMNNVVANSKSYTNVNTLGQSVLAHDNSGTYVQSSDSDTQVMQSNASNKPTLSQWSLRLLQSISDTLMRHNIVGTRFAERMKAQFGFTTKENKVNQSIFLKSFVFDSTFDPVVNMSPSDGSVLGEQAAKGICVGKGSLKFECSEWGALVFITQILPSIGYYQGRAPWTLARAPFEFYNASYDNQFMSPIRNDELFGEYQFTGTDTFADTQTYGGQPNGVFGFEPYGSYYKHGYDIVSGDFRLGSRNEGLESYHTLRILPQPSVATPLALNADFLQVKPNDYDRIFAIENSVSNYGHFATFDLNRAFFVDENGRVVFFIYHGAAYSLIYRSDSSDYVLSLVSNFSGTRLSYLLAYGSVEGGFVTSYTSFSDASFVLNDSMIQFTLTSSVLSPSADVLTTIEFNSEGTKNVDHFQGFFHFKVKGYRYMHPYSESLPMFDKSGKKVTTSYEGTQL